MRSLILLPAAALLFGLARSAQEPAVTVVPVATGLSMLVGQGGNVGVLSGPDGLFVIDSQFDRMAPALLKAMDGIQKGATVRWLVNTHFHGDHVGGNVQLGAQAVRMAHANVRTRMQTPAAGREASPAAALPTITWQEGISVHVNGQEVEIRHVGAAHTDGDSILLFPAAKAMHAGDLFFNKRFPFVDHDSGGSVAGLLVALKDIHANMPADWKIIPGHGDLASKADLAASIKMIETTLALVKERAAAKQSRAQIVAAGLPEEWSAWSWNFITTQKWLESLARECGVKE
jgi:glyoxylase-like metal-dependent hydrolase (beta-lactamase superfamily II)